VSIGTGTKLGPYEVQDFIGQGAMGVVYRAYHSDLERTGAVKVMQAITPDPDTVARFRHEAQAIARLRHPNIVDVYDFGEFQGTPYMIVEYVPGGSLAAKMAHGPLDRATALRYLRGIAAGLDYAHRHGVVHRDIKPANVLLTEDDSPVLADFGLAKLMHGSSLKSLTGVTTGTPAYMAPEQVTGGEVGPAADRYSLTSIAYEMLTGVIPFDGEALMELLYAQVHRYPSAPSARDQLLGPQVDAVVMRGLAKNPSERWESCTAFVNALDAALAVAPTAGGATMVMAPPAVATRPLAAAAVAAAPTVAVAPARPQVPAAPHPRRLPWRVLAVVAGVLILLVAVLGVVAWSANHRNYDLAISPQTAAAGDTVVVTADHLPANQAGQIELHSIVRTFGFRADASGAVNANVTLPRDIEPGDHVVKICWNNTCHQELTLHLIATVGQASPLPTSPPSASPSSSPYSSPSPTSNPTPAPTGCGAPAVFVPSISKLKGFTVTFKCFPAGSWTVSVVQNNTPYGAGRATTPGNVAYYSQQFSTPTLVKPLESARVIVCNASSRCYESATVTVSG
jgi:protein kinase-like protein